VTEAENDEDYKLITKSYVSDNDESFEEKLFENLIN